MEAKELLDTTLASYLDETHTLYINEDFLSGGPAKEVLTACCHEVYHAYQHRIVDAYHHADEREKDLQIYRKALYNSKEFENIQAEPKITLLITRSSVRLTQGVMLRLPRMIHGKNRRISGRIKAKRL